jgi:Carboxypeptidase regulatory-like domain
MCSEQCSAEGAEDRQPSGRSASAYISVLFLLSVGLLAPLPAACQETVVLSGQVVTYTGQTVPSDVTITLETESGERPAQTPANTEGRFELANLKKLRYRMTVTAEGFETWQQDLDLGRGAGQYTVRITLTPLNKVKQIPASAPALTDDQAPKTARKEYEKGSRALAAHELDEAYTHLQKAVFEFPCCARAQTDLAVVLTKRRELPGAEAALRQAVQCDPGFPYAQMQAYLQAEPEGRFAAKIKAIMRQMESSGALRAPPSQAAQPPPG